MSDAQQQIAELQRQIQQLSVQLAATNAKLEPSETPAGLADTLSPANIQRAPAPRELSTWTHDTLQPTTFGGAI
ncbi:hypothetical protein EV182_008455, partial [Spiromyces aspiralis]